jgi:hypothetical protein
MTKKEILQKMANLMPIPKIGTPRGTPGLITKIPKPTNINFNAKKISTNVPGGSLKTSKVITNG